MQPGGEDTEGNSLCRLRVSSAALILTAVFAFLAIAFVLFGSGGRDDIYITYWPAYTLANEGRIVNYNGQSLEQSSSLLHVLILGAIAKVANLRPDQFGWTLMFGCSALAVFLTGILAKRNLPKDLIWTLALVSTSPPLLYWGVSELEGPLVALTLLLVFAGWAAFLRTNHFFALLTAVPYLLSRPEAPLVLGCACIVLAMSKPIRRHSVYIFLSVLVLAGILATYRLYWTGYAAPLPAYVKGGFKPYNLIIGTEYLAFYLPLLSLALFGLVRHTKSNPSTSVMLSLVVGVLAFSLFVGGDSMEAWRFLVPITPFLAFGIAALSPPWRLTGFLGQLCALAVVAYSQSTGTPLWARVPVDRRFRWNETVCRDHRRDLQFSVRMNDIIRDLLKRQDKVSLISIRMGLTSYRAKLEFGDRVSLVDLIGLSDEELFKNGLTWSAKHPGQPPPWQKNLTNRKTAAFLDQQELIMVKHALFNRRTDLRDAVNGLPDRPDIIFMVADGEAYLESVRRLGYDVVFVDKHNLVCPGPLPGLAIRSTQSIAVRHQEP